MVDGIESESDISNAEGDSMTVTSAAIVKLVLEYDYTNPSKESARDYAKEWRHFFGGFKDPLGTIQSWLLAGISNAEAAAYISQTCKAADYSEFSAHCEDEYGTDIHNYKPGAIVRAMKLWKDGDPDFISVLKDGDYWAPRKPTPQ
jgi:hypothetical protein